MEVTFMLTSHVYPIYTFAKEGSNKQRMTETREKMLHAGVTKTTYPHDKQMFQVAQYC